MNLVLDFMQAVNTHAFMSRAMTASVIIGLMAGALGTFVILRGLSLMGDAISHAVIPGVALSHLLGVSTLVGASAFGILASFLIGFVTEKSTLKKDTIIGVVFSTFFALGLILISQIRTATDLFNVLFGNVLTVSDGDIANIRWVALGLLVFLVTMYKKLQLSSFDPTLAKVYGLNTRVIDYLFLVVLTLVIVVSLQVVGAVLIVSMIIAPAAIAYLLTNRLWIMLLLSAMIGAGVSVVGLFMSFTFNWPPGASIVLTLGILFTLTLFLSPQKGLLASRLYRKQVNRTHGVPRNMVVSSIK